MADTPDLGCLVPQGLEVQVLSRCTKLYFRVFSSQSDSDASGSGDTAGKRKGKQHHGYLLPTAESQRQEKLTVVLGQSGKRHFPMLWLRCKSRLAARIRGDDGKGRSEEMARPCASSAWAAKAVLPGTWKRAKTDMAAQSTSAEGGRNSQRGAQKRSSTPRLILNSRGLMHSIRIC